MLLTVYATPDKCEIEAFDSLDAEKPSARSSISMSADDFRGDIERLSFTCQKIAGDATIERLGLVVAGAVAEDGNGLALSGNLTHWVGKPVSTILREALGCQVTLVNDSVAAAMSEVRLQVPWPTFLYVFWDKGIGMTFVDCRDRRPVPYPTELGHSIIDRSAISTSCGCHVPGCLESIAGGRVIERHGSERSRLRESGERILDGMTQGVFNAMRAFPMTRCIVFGGDIAVREGWAIPEIERRLRGLQGETNQPVIVRVTDLREITVALGALAVMGADE